jgi:hypothetical protein
MNKPLLMFLLVLLIGNSISYGQTEKLKTVFIYNFTKYIQWPENAQDGDFIIGVVGKSAVTNELEAITKVKKVGNQPIVVRELSSVKEGSNSHIILISENASNQLESARTMAKGKPILIVGEKKGMATQGAAINFLVEGGKLLFEINRSNIESHSLKVSSQLLSLGKTVD